MKRTRKFLAASLGAILVLCTAVFLWITSYLRETSNDAIRDIGMIYMSEMSTQLQQKFDTIINLYYSQAAGIALRNPPETMTYSEQMVDTLSLNARIRDFTYLALYSEDGKCETLYGEPVELANMEEFTTAIYNDNTCITSGLNASGEKVLLLVVNAGYEMKSGSTSIALVAGLPMDRLNQSLALESEDCMVYSHIIRRDGTYVVRNGDAYRENYFTRMEEMIEDVNGGDSLQFSHDLRAAIDANEVYSRLALVDNSHRHLYCSPLPECNWYLISVMPYSVLDDAVSTLGVQRQAAILKASGIILAGILSVFALYFYLSQQQMRELNEARHEAVRANKAKSEFLSNMSHDIRTPMNGVVGMTAIALANIDDTPRVVDCLKKITLSSKHLLGLINDVLDMSKIETGKLNLNMEQLSLRDVMESIVNIVQPQIKAKAQHFDIFIRDIIVEDVLCDSVRLNQILINLLSNAIKFTPEGGMINVYISQEALPDDHEMVRCHFRVKDSGIGMSPEFQKRIFDTFTRDDSMQVQKTEGTGLGMAITKYIVDAIGGTIELTSEPGQGSEFHVTLDLKKSLLSEADMMLPPWNMLVVDNNEDLCVGTASALKEIGVNAEWVLDGESAIQMAEKRHREHNDYHFILLDWKMPGMDGLQTTRELRKRIGDNVPILIISAYDWGDIEDEAREAGAHGFISKPLFKSNLYLGLAPYMDTQTQDRQKKEEHSIDFTGKHILLAEDNDLNWEIAYELLSTVGFTLERAENGQVCVEKFSQSEVGTYDLILMDIRMPVMNGYTAAETIRAMDRTDAGLPIIAMTADSFSDDIQHCLDCGMNCHIAKPIDVQRLMTVLQKYMGA